MLNVHIVASSFNPKRGGLQVSAVRIAGHISELSQTRVFLYSRDDVLSLYPDSPFELCCFRGNYKLDAQPLFGDHFSFSDERYRLDSLLLSECVESNMRRFPSNKNVIISFSLCSTGFIAQNVATDLTIPHIACVRGSDFSQDSYNPHRVDGFAFVIEMADWVITTNNKQANSIRKRFGRVNRIRTIYNCVDLDDDAPLWNSPPLCKNEVRIVSDTGYSVKKGTLILLESVKQALSCGLNLSLTQLGSDEEGRGEYWDTVRKHYDHSWPGRFQFLSWETRKVVDSELARAHLFVSATLGEGCSNGLNRALAFGIPVIATDVAAINEIAADAPHLSLVRPANVQELTNALNQVGNEGYLRGRQDMIEPWVRAFRTRFSRGKEREEWQQLILEYLENALITLHSRKQHRVLLFVHDGVGLGHLKRVSNIARTLQGPCSCLVVTGHRAASWVVPNECEFVHLPSLDSLLDNKSIYWGRRPFLKTGKEDAFAFRKGVIESVAKCFRPDVIITDYLPLGKEHELDDVILASTSNYFILRGILDDMVNVRREILTLRATQALKSRFRRILVTSDKKICNVVEEYALDDTLVPKVSYTGYVSNPIRESVRLNVRATRGISKNEKWVVCSAGGGALGERLIEECISVSRSHPECYFDIVCGPRSGDKWEYPGFDSVIEGRVRFVREAGELPLLHASADVVICSGGYNSLVEVLEGGASLIVVPTQLKLNDEQFVHAQRLSKFIPLRIVVNVHQFRSAFEESLAEPPRAAQIRDILEFDGAKRIRDTVLADLAAV